ncbi:hypothetical protein ACOMDP_16715 [Pantoea dispersa]|uniref:hypothetical protein n=1 Tax=Pantoea TaxID=53335 RepID=UPI001404A5AE|nr:hypothetical protein [Pantoea sp. VS1]
MMVPYDEGWRQYQIDISPTSIMELSFFDSDHKFNYQIFDIFLSNAVVMRAGVAVAR